MEKEEVELLRENAKKVHKNRVAQNPNRIKYAMKQMMVHGIEFELKNKQTGHIHCRRKKDDRLFQFYAGTGKIMGEKDKRGIHQLIKILTEE